MPYDERNDETGRFDPSYSGEDFIDALRDAGGGLTTQEVRETVGCAYRTAHARLTDLEADGRVTSRDVGRAKLWTLASGEERAHGTAERPIDGADRGEDTAATGGDVSPPDAPESIEAVDVDALDLPGSGEDLRRRRDAVRAVLDHLREHGEAQAADLKEIAWRADGGSYSDAHSLWKNCILGRALPAVDAAESAGPSGKWRWVGE